MSSIGVATRIVNKTRVKTSLLYLYDWPEVHNQVCNNKVPIQYKVV